MTQSIERGALRAFFQPYADQGPRAALRVHIICGRMHYGAGYVRAVTDEALAKYSDGSNTTDWIAFSEIDELEVRDRLGALIQSITVID